MIRRPPTSTLLPYTTLCRSLCPSLPRATEFSTLRARVARGGAPRGAPSPVRGAREVQPPPGFLGEEAEVYEPGRSEEHTPELQSRQYVVCRLLFEKKNL